MIWHKQMIDNFSLRIWRLHPQGCKIIPAEKTLNGTANEAAVKFCQPYTSANSQGFWVFPPADIDICWKGDTFDYKIISEYTHVDHDLVKSMLREGEAKVEMFCPEGQGRTKYGWGNVEKNVVQIWTGCIFHTPPGWNLQIRSPVNCEPRPCFVMEGVLETDWMQYDIWLNVVFTRQNEWVHLRRDDWPPIAQLIPVLRTEKATWKIESDKIVNRDDPEGNRVFEFWQQYNHKKFCQGGKQALLADGSRTKDATTFYKERKRMLNDGYPKPEHMCPREIKKIRPKFVKKGQISSTCPRKDNG